MENKKPIDVEFGESNLTKIVFNYQNIPEKDSFEVKVKDTADVNVLNERAFEIIYSRQTTTNEPFTFVVEFKVIITVKNLEQLKENNETLEEFANRKKKEIIERLTLPVRASLLIGNMTKECGGAFVTIPVFYDKEK